MNIIHAGGVIDNMGYSNSKESIEYNIMHNANKVFEIDVVKIKDAYVIAHDWVEKDFYEYDGKFRDISYEDYKKLRVFKKYTPMDFYMLKEIIERHPEFKYILDIKDNGDDYRDALIYIKTIFGENIANFIPQIYEESDLQHCIDNNFICCHLALWKREYRGYEIFADETIEFINSMVNRATLNNIQIFGISVWYKHLNDSLFEAFHSKCSRKIYLHGQGDIDDAIYSRVNSLGIGFFRGFEPK